MIRMAVSVAACPTLTTGHRAVRGGLMSSRYSLLLTARGDYSWILMAN